MQGKKSLISKEQVISTLQRLATELGRAPTREELEQMSGISPAVVRKYFTRHRAAVRAAGLEPAPTGPGRVIQNEDLLEDWGRVMRELKRMPTRTEYASAGKYSYRCVIDRFQRWRLTGAAFVDAEAKGCAARRMERRGGDDTKHARAATGTAGAVGKKVYGSSTTKRASAVERQ
jgi:hypothetical protein